ncbi:MAG: proline racemase family protein [Hyphomicrobiales bacterium]|nr:proline racemase family protein [Hyphomicrobiales bacterium]
MLVDNWPSSAAAWLARNGDNVLLVVDSHTGGNPTRIVLGGLKIPPEVQTVDVARTWLRQNADWVRTRLVHEPRGGGLTCAVVPIMTQEDGCDIGAVILEPGSYPPMCGHCMIGFATVIVELDLIPGLWRASGEETSFKIRTPAGPVGVTARRSPGSPVSITLTNVGSHIVKSDTCCLPTGDIPIELVYGGDYYITADADRIGLSLERDNATEIVSLARKIAASYTRGGVFDPLTGEKLDVYQVMFFRRLPGSGPRAKVVVVAPPGVIDRSPCGTGSSALYALQHGRKEIETGQTLTTESIIGSTFTVQCQSVDTKRGREEVTPLLTGSAFINGFLTIVADGRDSLADGIPPL